MSRQIDVRPPVYNPAFVHDRVTSAASHSALAARHLVRRSRKFIVDFAQLRLLDGPRFNAAVLSHEPVRRQFGNLASQARSTYTVPLGLPLVRALAARLCLVLSVLDAVENIEEMNQPTLYLALKGDLSLKEAAMRMKWGIGRANLKELGLSVA